jgi:serine/threonine protein phosphatase 1
MNGGSFWGQIANALSVGRRAKRVTPPIRVKTLAPSPAVIYAIGDVHGCYDLLLDLERMIVADSDAYEGEKSIVMLGDYVDRGPSPALVLGHLSASPPVGFDRICLQGNHEKALLDFLGGHLSLSRWLDMGATTTLASYGIDATVLNPANARAKTLSAMPSEHLNFVGKLPLAVETPDYVFVHAGMREGVPLSSQRQNDILYGVKGAEYHTETRLVVHGHAARVAPAIVGRDVSVDTGAYGTGRLTAVRLVVNNPPMFLASKLRSGDKGLS